MCDIVKSHDGRKSTKHSQEMSCEMLWEHVRENQFGLQKSLKLMFIFSFLILIGFSILDPSGLWVQGLGAWLAAQICQATWVQYKCSGVHSHRSTTGCLRRTRSPTRPPKCVVLGVTPCDVSIQAPPLWVLVWFLSGLILTPRICQSSRSYGYFAALYRVVREAQFQRWRNQS